MWLFAIFFIAIAQYNDKDDVKQPTLDILKNCGFTNEEFERLKSIFTTDVPELRKKMDATREARNKRMDQLWANAKERAKKFEGNAEDILNDELTQIKEFLNEISKADGNPIKGAGKPMEFSLIGEDERERILEAISNRYKEGATSSKDFKVMFNVMRAYLVIRGSEHIDEAKKEVQEQRKEEDRAKEEEKRKDDRKPKRVVPVNTGLKNAGDGYEAPRYGNGEWNKDTDAPKGKRTEPYTQMEKDHGHHLPSNQEDEEDENDDPERGDEDDDEEEREKKGNDAKYGKEPIDSDKEKEGREEQKEEKPEDDKEKEKPKKASGHWEDISPSDGDSKTLESPAAPEGPKTPSAPDANQQPATPGTPTAPGANQTPQQPSSPANTPPQGAPPAAPAQQGGAPPAVPAPAVPAQQGGAPPAAPAQQGGAPPAVPAQQGGAPPATPAQQEGASPATPPGGTNNAAAGDAATAPQPQPGNGAPASQTGAQPSPESNSPPPNTPGATPQGATPAVPANGGAQPPAQGPAPGTPPADNAAAPAKADANAPPAGADDAANAPATPPTTSLLTSIPGALHFTTTQLRYSIYVFCLFVVIVGCYLLSPTKDSELDYLLIDGDDEI